MDTFHYHHYYCGNVCALNPHLFGWLGGFPSPLPVSPSGFLYHPHKTSPHVHTMLHIRSTGLPGSRQNRRFIYIVRLQVPGTLSPPEPRCAPRPSQVQASKSPTPRAAGIPRALFSPLLRRRKRGFRFRVKAVHVPFHFKPWSLPIPGKVSVLLSRCCIVSGFCDKLVERKTHLSLGGDSTNPEFKISII